MPTLHDIQSAVRDFVLSVPGADAPAGLFADDGLIGARRLAIHRNNAIITLGEALGAVYPVARRLVGADFFQAACAAYVRAHPPRVRTLIAYGGAFADFLSGYGPASGLAYLPDVARLEWAWHDAFHAADAAPIGPDALAGIDPADAAALKVFTHPSVRLIRSRYPVWRIWEVNQPNRTTVEPVHLDEGPAHVMVVRPHLSVAVHDLDAGAYALSEALAGGAPLGAACAVAEAAGPGFKPGPALANLIAAGAVVGFLAGAGSTADSGKDTPT